MPSDWANAHWGLAVQSRVGEATLPHPYKPLGIPVGPLPHRQVSLSPSPRSWGQLATIYLSRWD